MSNGGFKPGSLAVRWRSNFEGNGPDLVYIYDRKIDGRLIHWFFDHAKLADKNLVDHLEERGYDISTLQFTIRKKR